MRKILIVDNYDSFVFNIVQLLREAESVREYEVVRNDQVQLTGLDSYDGVILSPGPGTPEEAGALLPLIGACKHTHPILGVCLGHQAIGQAFGARLLNLPAPLHGHRTTLTLTDSSDPLLRGLVFPATVGRYHSWVVDPCSLPADLVVSSLDEQGNIMSLYHHSLPIHGVQFHPESYMSDCGAVLIKNWLKIVDQMP